MFGKAAPLNFPWKIPAPVIGFLFCGPFRSLLVSFECLAAFSVTQAVTNRCEGFHKQLLPWKKWGSLFSGVPRAPRV